MRFGMLGSLEVVVGDDLVELGSPKQRAVLALLLITRTRVVSLDRLIDELWAGEPPPRATASLQAYLSNLRRVLEPARRVRTPASVIVTAPPGYVLRTSRAEVDVDIVERDASTGRALLAQKRPAEARERLDAALHLWRGPALADFTYEPFAQVEIARLDELRLRVFEDRLTADLASGAHADAIPELEALVCQHPLREQFRALLMLALYRSGRQADALRAFQAARDAL